LKWFERAKLKGEIYNQNLRRGHEPKPSKA